MYSIGRRTVHCAIRASLGILSALFILNFYSRQAASAVLPLPSEQDSWSDMAFPSVATGSFIAASKALSITTPAGSDLEIGSQFGPSNPGRHYGTGGTLGGLFSAAFTVCGVTIEPNGSVSNGGSVLMTFNNGSPGSIGDDYCVLAGASLLQGTVLEVLLSATGSNTLDILYAITGGALQLDNQDPNVGVYAPRNVSLLRIAASAIPSNGSTNFNLSGATIDSFGLVLAGDYNGNVTVGPEDYSVWKTSYGSATNLAADGSNNHIIDAADYTVWRDHLGQTAGSGSLSNITVPEPATMLLLILAATGSRKRNCV
jgi:hypothetical protein